MKKLLFGALTFALIITSCIKDDLADLDKKIDDLNTKITALATQVAGVETLQLGLISAQAQLTLLSDAVAALPGTASTDALSASLETLTASVNSISTALGTLADNVATGTVSTQDLVNQLITTTANNQTATTALVTSVQDALTAAIAVGDSTLAATLTTELAAAALANATAITAAQDALTLDNTDQSTALTLLIEAMQASLDLAKADIAEILAAHVSPLTAVTIDNTTPQVGFLLTALPVTALGATTSATYQWYTGSSTLIAGATASTYTVLLADVGLTIKVKATGTGNALSAEISSASTSAVIAQTLVTGVNAFAGTLRVGAELTSGAPIPSTATITYQWESSATGATDIFTAIAGATAKTYTLVTGDITKYIRVTITGTGGFSGTVSSAVQGPITYPVLLTADPVLSTNEPLVGTVLSFTQSQLGTISSTTTATYQWESSATGVTDTFTAIDGATSRTYTVVVGDLTRFIQVAVTGTGGFYGTVTSSPTGTAVLYPLAFNSVTIDGSLSVGSTLTATKDPTDATVTYQWQVSSGATFINIPGATSATYVIDGGDFGENIQVVATATGGYYGTKTSNVLGTVTAGDITSDPFTMLASNNIVTLTLNGGGEWADAPIAANTDLFVTGLDEVILEGGIITRVSDNVVTITRDEGDFAAFTSSNSNIITVDAGAMTTQATSVTVTPGTQVVYATVATTPNIAMVTGNTTVTITLTGGTFRTGDIFASDFGITGTNNDAVSAGTFARTSGTVVTITGISMPSATSDIVITVLPYAMATQATSVAGVITPVVAITSAAFTMQTGSNRVIITLTSGVFKQGTPVVGDFTFTGTDLGAIGGGVFVRTSDTVVTITVPTGLVGTDNVVLVKAATQTTQAASVAVTQATI